MVSKEPGRLVWSVVSSYQQVNVGLLSSSSIVGLAFAFDRTVHSSCLAAGDYSAQDQFLFFKCLVLSLLAKLSRVRTEEKDRACCLLVGVGSTCFLNGLKQPVKRFKSGGKQNWGRGGVTRFGQFVYLLSHSGSAGQGAEGVTCAGLCPGSTWRGASLVCVTPCPANRKFSKGLASKMLLHGRAKAKVNVPCCGPSARVSSLFPGVISETNGDRQFRLTFVQPSDHCYQDAKLGASQ